MNDSLINTQAEIMLVGAIYAQPDLIVSHSYYIREDFDFADPATNFFYTCAYTMYSTHSTDFTKSNIMSFMIEDTNRLARYKKFGGWKTLQSWIKLADVDDFNNYFNIVKKFSLLREYDRRGFDVQKIREWENFDNMSPTDVYKVVRSNADEVKTVIMPENESEILNSMTTETILKCLDTPDQGIPYPFNMWNEMFRGARKSTMLMIGMLSNAGKSRLLCYIAAYIALVQHQTVFILLNEMSAQEFRYCLITTVINSPFFQAMHGIKRNKCEREITLGIYRDDRGEVINRYRGSDGCFTESLEDYVSRMRETSQEFRDIEAVTNWIDSNTEDKIIVKDIQNDYSTSNVAFELRRAKMINNIDFVAYDTLKTTTQNIGSWDQMKALATVLSELCKEIDIHLIATFQLTDDTVNIDPLEMSSMNVATAKQIIHLTDQMVVFSEPKKENYTKYVYRQDSEEWGVVPAHELNAKYRYYIMKTLKNRAGNKLSLAFKLDLDYNTWECVGEVRKKF